jgi:hypothetical protein
MSVFNIPRTEAARDRVKRDSLERERDQYKQLYEDLVSHLSLTFDDLESGKEVTLYSDMLSKAPIKIARK